jgi:hypothetical protein
LEHEIGKVPDMWLKLNAVIVDQYGDKPEQYALMLSVQNGVDGNANDKKNQ